jgi:hypothetical protein
MDFFQIFTRELNQGITGMATRHFPGDRVEKDIARFKLWRKAVRVNFTEGSRGNEGEALIQFPDIIEVPTHGVINPLGVLAQYSKRGIQAGKSHPKLASAELCNGSYAEHIKHQHKRVKPPLKDDRPATGQGALLGCMIVHSIWEHTEDLKRFQAPKVVGGAGGCTPISGLSGSSASPGMACQALCPRGKDSSFAAAHSIAPSVCGGYFSNT